MFVDPLTFRTFLERFSILMAQGINHGFINYQCGIGLQEEYANGIQEYPISSTLNGYLPYVIPVEWGNQASIIHKESPCMLMFRSNLCIISPTIPAFDKITTKCSKKD